MEKGHWLVVGGRKEAAVPWGLQRREGRGSLCGEDWSPTPRSFPGPMGRWVQRPHHQDHQAQGASVIS